MSTEEQLKTLISEIKKLTKSSEEQEKAIVNMTAKLESKLDTHKKEISDLIEEKLGSCIQRVDKLEQTVEKLDERLEDNVDISTRICNLLLTGIPFKEGENVSNIVKTLSHKLGYEEPPETIQYRFKSDNPRRPIMIRFATEFHKMQFLQLYYKVAKNLTCSVFAGFTGDDNRIYLQHDFTPIQYKLHKSAMSLKKAKKIAEVKVNLGNIIVIKVDPRGKFKAYNSDEDLQKEIASSIE